MLEPHLNTTLFPYDHHGYLCFERVSMDENIGHSTLYRLSLVYA